MLAADQYHRVRHFLQSGEHALTAEVCIIEYSMADPRVDAVIEEVLGGDLHMPEREQLVDEAAYQYFSQIREQQGHQLSPEAAEQINAMVVIPQAEKGGRMRLALPQHCSNGPIAAAGDSMGL